MSQTNERLPLKGDTVKMIVLTSEICGGARWSDEVGEYIKAHIEHYGDAAVRHALKRCQLEVKGLLSLADIIARIPDGRPPVAVAYAQVSGSEADTFITTDEVLAAWGIASQTDGDKFAQRSAFDAAYKEICAGNRINGVFPKQIVSIGHDKARAKAAIEAGVKQGLLRPTDPVAAQYFPEEVARAALPPGTAPKQLPAPRTKPDYKAKVNRSAEITAMLAGLAEKVKPIDGKSADKLTADEIQARMRELEALSARIPRRSELQAKIND